MASAITLGCFKYNETMSVNLAINIYNYYGEYTVKDLSPILKVTKTEFINWVRTDNKNFLSPGLSLIYYYTGGGEEQTGIWDADNHAALPLPYLDSETMIVGKQGTDIYIVSPQHKDAISSMKVPF